MTGTINVHPILSSVGAPRLGMTVNLPIARAFQASLGTLGLEVGGGRIVPLSPDGIFLISLGANFPPFIGFLGGEAAASSPRPSSRSPGSRSSPG